MLKENVSIPHSYFSTHLVKQQGTNLYIVSIPHSYFSTVENTKDLVLLDSGVNSS